MEIGLRLGIDKFSYYLQGFGLKEKTGRSGACAPPPDYTSSA